MCYPLIQKYVKGSSLHWSRVAGHSCPSYAYTRCPDSGVKGTKTVHALLTKHRPSPAEESSIKAPYELLGSGHIGLQDKHNSYLLKSDSQVGKIDIENNYRKYKSYQRGINKLLKEHR